MPDWARSPLVQNDGDELALLGGQLGVPGERVVEEGRGDGAVPAADAGGVAVEGAALDGEHVGGRVLGLVVAADGERRAVGAFEAVVAAGGGAEGDGAGGCRGTRRRGVRAVAAGTTSGPGRSGWGRSTRVASTSARVKIERSAVTASPAAARILARSLAVRTVGLARPRLWCRSVGVRPWRRARSHQSASRSASSAAVLAGRVVATTLLSSSRVEARPRASSSSRMASLISRRRWLNSSRTGSVMPAISQPPRRPGR